MKRPIKVLKISDNVAVDEPAEGDVLIVALHHAREWISVETSLYIAEQILTQYAANPRLKADVKKLQIWIVPVVNPDGFAYTWSSPANRYWRKNRRNNGDGTFGVDLNRNWGHLGTRQRLVARYQQRHLSGNRAFQRAGNGGDTGFRQLLAQPENHADLP